jgi:hypothetical protein
MPAEPSGTTADPFFSVVVTTYNRAQIVPRCVESCLAQSFSDFELVVVDDGSTDGTAPVLESIGDQRLRLVVHEANRGISPARHTGVANASGEWIVSLDSDDELFPHTLERLHQIIERLPPDVRIVRSRLLWDDGTVTPKVVPAGPIDYEARIRWMEADWGSDSGRCMHRSVFDANPYFSDRRGPVEALHELNLSRSELSICVEDVLGIAHTDAGARAGAISRVRRIAASELAPQLLRDAPDMLWMAETTLDQHGAALARHAPRVYRTLIRTASAQAFLLGDRAKGTRYARAALKKRRLDPMAWATLLLGLLGPRAVVGGALAHRWMNRFRR